MYKKTQDLIIANTTGLFIKENELVFELDDNGYKHITIDLTKVFPQIRYSELKSTRFEFGDHLTGYSRVKKADAIKLIEGKMANDENINQNCALETI